MAYNSNLQPPTSPQPDRRARHEPQILLDPAELLRDGLAVLDPAVHEGLGHSEAGAGVLGHDDLGAGVDDRQGQALRVPGGVDGDVACEGEDVGGEGMQLGEGGGDV